MTMIESPTWGLERAGRETLIILMQTLNEELPNQDALWAPLDEELAELRGVDYVPITLELVQPQNFYPGHRPSLIEAPVDRYPNVSVMADRAGPSESDSQYDQFSEYALRVYIEFMVKSLSNEQEVNSRAQRTADAINICMMSNRTLRGVVSDIEGAGNAQLSEVFIRKERTSTGAEWYWQGGRIEYVVTKTADMPSGESARPAMMASSPSVLGANFDQQ